MLLLAYIILYILSHHCHILIQDRNLESIRSVCFTFNYLFKEKSIYIHEKKSNIKLFF